MALAVPRQCALGLPSRQSVRNGAFRSSLVAPPQARRVVALASEDDKTPTSSASTSAQPPAAAPAEPAKEPLILKKGQGTAIITGAVSVVFGVAYLILVFLLDSRGGELLPPPPEAFGP